MENLGLPRLCKVPKWYISQGGWLSLLVIDGMSPPCHFLKTVPVPLCTSLVGNSSAARSIQLALNFALGTI